MRRLPSASPATLSLAITSLAVIVALAVRVIPVYNTVMTPFGVNFQDSDSWYHMRAVHNIAAHFPRQSGFDPYALYAGRQNAYTEPWDVFIAGVAGLIALGMPSASLIDQVGAWLPAVLGALLPIPLFFLTKRLFGAAPACWAAIAAAVIPGTLVWVTHLGVPDHHVAECLLSICALVFLCGAVETVGRAMLWRIIVSGLLFGTYLCVRPAGIFVPATLAIAALIEPLLAPYVAATLAIASAVFLASSGNIWAKYTWLTLACTITACLLAWALGVLWRKRAWSKALLLPAVGIAAAVAIGIVAALQPAVFQSLVETVGRYVPGLQSGSKSYLVAELSPLWDVPPGGVGSIFEFLGPVWLPAFPVLLCAFPAIWRSRRPALVLCSVWGLVMTAAGVIQMRMMVYGEPAIAVAAGVGCAWLMAQLPRFRTALSVSTAVFLFVSGVPHSAAHSVTDGGPRLEWRQALAWLRWNTPEPMGDPKAWLGYWPALTPGKDFAYPASAYSVLTWWDFGDWVNAIGHRIPSTNGTQTNADTVAAFLTAASPEAARSLASQMHARYAVLNFEVTGKLWETVLRWSNRTVSRYQQVIFTNTPTGGRIPLIIYLPDYYKTMAVRIYNFDGQPISAGSEISAFITKPVRDVSGMQIDVLEREEKFESQEKLQEYRLLHPGQSVLVGSNDPLVSCVNVDGLDWVKPVFASSGQAGPRTVKVFEMNP